MKTTATLAGLALLFLTGCASAFAGGPEGCGVKTWGTGQGRTFCSARDYPGADPSPGFCDTCALIDAFNPGIK